MNHSGFSRRMFLQRGLVLAAGTPFALRGVPGRLLAATAPPSRNTPAVAIVACKSYNAEVRAALARCFDLLGGIKPLVHTKTVTVKLNLTGSDFRPLLGRPVWETYMTHPGTAVALAALLVEAGAKRVRFVESTQRREPLEATLTAAQWDVKQLESIGRIEFENTRNLGKGKSYAHLKVPNGGYTFSAIDVNRAYEDTDVLVSLAKLKNHLTAGVTLSLKNLFGIPPNSLYGEDGGSEDAVQARFPLHEGKGAERVKPPGLKPGDMPPEPTWRVPRTTVDICAARPIDLAIIDGITSMSGGEGPWCAGSRELKFTTPGLVLAGFNALATDAVGTAVMGYADPRAPRGAKPFESCDNHLLLAEKAGLGTADLARIDVRGLSIEKATYPYG